MLPSPPLYMESSFNTFTYEIRIDLFPSLSLSFSHNFLSKQVSKFVQGSQKKRKSEGEASSVNLRTTNFLASTQCDGATMFKLNSSAQVDLHSKLVLTLNFYEFISD